MSSVSTRQEISPKLLQSWIIWSCAALFFCYQFIIRVSPSVMTQELMNSFHVDACALGTLTSFFFWAYAGLQVPVGVLLDRLGPRRLLTSAALICSLGSFIFATADGILVASIGRFLIGTGSAFAFLSCMKLGTIWFPPQQLPTVIGMTLLLGTLGASTGGIPMSSLVDNLGWRNAIYLTSILGLGVAFLLWYSIKDQASLALKNYIKQHHNEPPQELNVIDGFKVILKKPQTWLLAFYGMMMYVPLSGFADMWGVTFLMSVHQLDKPTAAICTSVLYIGVGLGTPLFAFLSNSLKQFNISLQCASLGALSTLSIIFYFPNLPTTLVIALMLLTGIMLGGQFIIYSVVSEINPLSISGSATGFQNSVSLMSGVIFQPFLGGLLDFFWSGKVINGIPFYSMLNYQYAISSITVCAALAALCLPFIKESYPLR